MTFLEPKYSGTESESEREREIDQAENETEQRDLSVRRENGLKAKTY